MTEEKTICVCNLIFKPIKVWAITQIGKRFKKKHLSIDADKLVRGDTKQTINKHLLLYQ